MADLTNYLLNAYSTASLNYGDFTGMGTLGNSMHVWGHKAGFGGQLLDITAGILTAKNAYDAEYAENSAG